jgi:hypothetical protein
MFDNPQVRVLRVTIPGKAKVPLHEHARNRVVVYLSDAAVRITSDTGVAAESRVAAGEVRGPARLNTPKRTWQTTRLTSWSWN